MTKYLVNSKNVKIQNSVNEIEIELFGDVGESWFSEESITINKVKEIINDNKNKNLLFKIASLGGDVEHAFVIFDLIRMHKGRTKSLIMGLTASAGTIIAAAADRREMSENALMLVHQVWTIDMGNADQLRKTASDLDKFDERLVNIYRKITGRTDQEVMDLMKEEKWISPDEALEFGFVDKINERNIAIAASYDISKLSDNLKLKLKEMGLFNKNKTPNTAQLQDGGTLIFEGDLEKGTILNKAGEASPKLEGELILNDGRTLVVDANNAVTEIKEAKNEEKTIVDEVAKMIAPLMDKIESLEKDLSDLRTKGSAEKPAKKDGPENKQDVVTMKAAQATANREISQELKDKVKAARNQVQNVKFV